MFELEKSFAFEAGHILEHHDGRCSLPHGHSYVVKIVIRSKTIHASGPEQGMVSDFTRIKATVQPMIDQYFDHCWLNETLKTSSPTAEFIAKWIFDYLEPKIPGLFRINVQETATGSASYFREEQQ
jgi:6-pyruvoyltetrahydropterin/6-carboxytetrahydropterin synthase